MAPAPDEVNWASYLAFKWLDPLVTVGYERQVNLQDSPPLADQEDTARNTPLGGISVLHSPAR